MLWEFAQRVTAFGCLGWIVEVLFTGIHNLVTGNKAATGKTYLWMFPVWGFGGTVLELIKDVTTTAPNLWWHVALRGLLFTFTIFVMEFTWGWIFEKLLGRCPWKYTVPGGEQIHKFSVMGFIRLDYAFFWYGLAIGFDLYAYKIKFLINTLSRL